MVVVVGAGGGVRGGRKSAHFSAICLQPVRNDAAERERSLCLALRQRVMGDEKADRGQGQYH